MAIQIQSQKKTNIGLIIAVVVLVLIAGWLGWSFLKPVPINRKPSLQDVLPSSSPVPSELHVNKVLNSPVFQTLIPHITWPLSIPSLGRSNPFKPF